MAAKGASGVNVRPVAMPPESSLRLAEQPPSQAREAATLRYYLDASNPHARAPALATAGAAGFDLTAAVDEPLTLEPGHRALVSTGLYLEIPQGMEGQVRPRSGLAYKHGITVLNAPGTIDADYRGEVRVLLVNLSDVPYQIVSGDRIAQLVLARVASIDLHAVPSVAELDATARGDGGFGSSGR